MNKEFLKMQKTAGLITENQFKQLNEAEDLLSMLQSYIRFYAMAEEGTGIVPGDEIDPITKRGKPVHAVDYADAKKEELKNKIINLKEEEYFDALDYFANLETFFGDEDKMEELADKLGFTSDQLKEL